MDASPALSNSADIMAALAAWRRAAVECQTSIRIYMAEAGSAGPRSIGERWAAAAKMADAAGAGLTPPADGPMTFAALLGAADAIESAARVLAGVARTVYAPAVQKAAMAGMSHTYSENLSVFGRRVADAAAAARAAQRNVMAVAAAASARRSIAEIVAARGAAKSGVAMQLYASALLCCADADRAEAASLLAAAMDEAFGLPPDSAAAAAADAAALAEYHPLQTMTWTPCAFGDGTPISPDKSAVVNLRLPQARIAVQYDIGPLIDRARALKFGPLASTTAGLSYRLVERLRTIRASPIAMPSATLSLSPPTAVISGPLLVTVDGETAIALHDGVAAPWAPLAGARPRVAAHAAASAVIILAAVRVGRTEGWDFEIRAKYEAATASQEAPAVSSEVLAAALVETFGGVYDAAPPKDPEAFTELVTPKKPLPNDYFCAAAGRCAAAAVDARLHALFLKPAGRIPHATIASEARVAAAITAIDVGRELWRRTRAVFRPESDAPFRMAAVQKRAVLMRTFRGAVAAALRMDPPIDCAPTNLKWFAATR